MIIKRSVKESMTCVLLLLSTVCSYSKKSCVLRNAKNLLLYCKFCDDSLGSF